MAWPATDISNRAAGDFVTDVMWDELVDALNFLANRPACRVRHSAAQSIANDTLVALAFNTEYFDTDTMHDTVTNNSRITFTTAGLYAITCTVEFAANGTGRRELLLRTGGSTFIAGQEAVPNSADGHLVTVATIYKFSAATYVEAVVKQTSGGALDVGSFANLHPEFAAVWVGRG